MRQILFLLLAIITLTIPGIGQSIPGLANTLFKPGENLNHNLSWPWTGGLNSCQFCQLDLNLDGTQDLFIFDRHGNRKLSFTGANHTGTVEYTYAPHMSMKIPALHDWVISADYNRDGKTDLFTYGNGGIRVFRNISDTSLKFDLVTDLLQSYYYTGYVGILVTSVDYPAIADIDGDGDLDLLTFFGLGSFVEYHQNLSMEKYGNCDSLDFKLSDHCWGRFKESESGNRITLNVDCPFNDQSLEKDAGMTRHTGSTLFATDLNDDGLKDLILGDYDYPGLIALYNGGTKDSAFITAMDTAFPSATRPVNLFSFPSVNLIDIDQDGLSDLVVSPFDPGLYTSENYNCVWYYKNSGTPEVPVFEYTSDRLFRSEMLDFGSASHPVLFDFNKDGLLDLFVGNDGYYDSSWYQNGVLHSNFKAGISYFRNTGTAINPIFTNITDDLAGIRSLNMRGVYPSFCDLNNDGYTDLVTGCSDGTLTLFLQNPLWSENPRFDAPVKNWMKIDVGSYSTPQFYDIDHDLAPDLIVGEMNGNLNYFKQTGDRNEFSLITDSLGKVNVTNLNLSYYGFSVPDFEQDQQGHTFLIVGADDGRIHLFGNIDNNLEGTFSESDSLYRWIASNPADTLFGWQSSPAIGRLSDPAAFDLITGNFSGGLNYLSKRNQAVIIPGMADHLPASLTTRLKAFPNPAHELLNLESGSPTRSSAGYIYNRIGQCIHEFQASERIQISTTGFTEGIYLVRWQGGTARFIITH